MRSIINIGAFDAFLRYAHDLPYYRLDYDGDNVGHIFPERVHLTNKVDFVNDSFEDFANICREAVKDLENE